MKKRPRHDQQDFNNQIFDSQFERDVFYKIRDRGYRVTPQFTVAQFKIDMVIEGLKSRLAVECDGHKRLEAVQSEYEILRQQKLEKFGWTFLRISISSFYRDPEQSLKPLWKKLNEMDIRGTV